MTRLLTLTLACIALLIFSIPGDARAEQQNTIIYGDDYKVYNQSQRGWRRCARACRDDAQCKAWTYIRTVNQCRLKRAIWLSTPNNCCVSGVQNAGQQPQPQPQPQPDPRGAEKVDNAKIARIRYNGRNTDRGVCIQTQPGVPRFYRGWACLWKNNPLYAETDAMIREAHSRGMTCTIEWSEQPRRRFAEILAVDCLRP